MKRLLDSGWAILAFIVFFQIVLPIAGFAVLGGRSWTDRERRMWNAMPESARESFEAREAAESSEAATERAGDSTPSPVAR